MLDVVHRFEDPAYADLSLLMRRGERTGEVFDRLLARGEIRIHATDVERRQALILETGLVIQVPPFVNEGDKVRVNTETGEYQSRV